MEGMTWVGVNYHSRFLLQLEYIHYQCRGTTHLASNWGWNNQSPNVKLLVANSYNYKKTIYGTGAFWKSSFWLICALKPTFFAINQYWISKDRIFDQNRDHNTNLWVINEVCGYDKCWWCWGREVRLLTTSTHHLVCFLILPLLFIFLPVIISQ